jgi:hypothetical protein
MSTAAHQPYLQFLDRSGDQKPSNAPPKATDVSETVRGPRDRHLQSVDVVNPVFHAAEAAEVQRRLKTAVTKEAEDRIRNAAPKPVRLSTELFIKTGWGLLFIMYNSVRDKGMATCSAAGSARAEYRRRSSVVAIVVVVVVVILY